MHRANSDLKAAMDRLKKTQEESIAKSLYISQLEMNVGDSRAEIKRLKHELDEKDKELKTQREMGNKTQKDREEEMKRHAEEMEQKLRLARQEVNLLKNTLDAGVEETSKPTKDTEENLPDLVQEKEDMEVEKQTESAESKTDSEQQFHTEENTW